MIPVKLAVAFCVLYNFLQMSDSNYTWDVVFPLEDANEDIDCTEEVHVAENSKLESDEHDKPISACLKGAKGWRSPQLPGH